ncbi:MAG TPA: ATP-binding protein [Blastocatellia bacterium]|nr:ATP-binding protein [Blastocatellia bacterium]
MRSLFLKIFLWFWLALGLLVVAGVLVVATTETEPVRARWREVMGGALVFYAQSAVEVLERDGRGKLNDYLERLERSSRIHAVVFDRQGHELSGRTVPAGAQELARRAAQSNRTEADFFPARTLTAYRVSASSTGSPYVIVCEIPGGLLTPLRASPRVRLLRLLTVILTAGLVCYGLARYLTTPVVKLREATQRLAGGDLRARVGAAFGNRRDELADLGRDFDLMAERIEGLVTAQQRLVSDVSHELRSPLARLVVALELARQRAGAEAGGALDRIEREADRLNDLIGQLLTLSRLENGAGGAPNQVIDLAALVREVAEDADFEARSRNRAVRIVASEDCTTSGSAELLRRAIENVVRNALRYTVEQTEVAISIQRENSGQAVITVRDHGPGVPETALADLFRPFYRVAEARDRKTGGIGLGLAITERAVRLHGGTIRADNASEGGLVVEIRLPISK